jgi:NAD(P)H dehydrogenase (quinone)
MDMLMVIAHPNRGSLCHAVSAAATSGLEEAGHRVTQLDLYALGFDPSMSADEHRAYMAGAEAPDAMVREHGALLHSVKGLVFVYPTWWSGPPAILRGWLERVFVPGVAFHFDERGKVRPGLTHIRRIIGISTYGSPWSYVKLVNDNGRRMITRALRLDCGRRTSTTWLGLYSIDTTGDNERRAFLDRVEHTMANVR